VTAELVTECDRVLKQNKAVFING